MTLIESHCFGQSQCEMFSMPIQHHLMGKTFTIISGPRASEPASSLFSLALGIRIFAAALRRGIMVRGHQLHLDRDAKADRRGNQLLHVRCTVLDHGHRRIHSARKICQPTNFDTAGF